MILEKKTKKNQVSLRAHDKG